MTPARALVRTVVIALVAAAVVMLVIVAAGWTPRVEFVLALAMSGAVVTVAFRRILDSVAEPPWPSAPSHQPEAVGTDPRIATIETSLRRSVEDGGVARRRVQPLLFDLATHRLRQLRGVELIEDPEAARTLLGDVPFGFLTEVVVDPMPVESLRRTVAAIERL